LRFIMYCIILLVHIFSDSNYALNVEEWFYETSRT
jgi:hypothetical protein